MVAIEPPTAICQVERVEVGNEHHTIELPRSAVRIEMVIRRDQLTPGGTYVERSLSGNWTRYTVQCSRHAFHW